MTSEICVMNRLAVVLAADSATTVTHYTSKGRETRYFKGANKIFQLSLSEPVGLMIYDSASILRVPWEIVIKDFRKHLGAKSYNTLQEYADEFFTHIETAAYLFPEEVQSSEFRAACRSAAFGMLAGVPTKEADADKKAALEDVIAKAEAANNEAGHNDSFDEEFTQKQFAVFQDPLVEDLQGILASVKYPEPDDLIKFAIAAINEVLRNPGQYFGTTGLVFAGYGIHSPFPSMVHYESQGLVMGRHVSKLTEEPAVIDHEIPAAVSAFAQTSMSDTFTRGLSFDVYKTLMAAVGDGLARLSDQLLQKTGKDANEIADLADIVDSARKQISSTVLDTTREEHALPLRRVLGSLPIEEMAELAETLINLQSLKEKVTMPSETVGGPVDVAVITRNEGLVWIKRKHYFPADLNARYTRRIQNGL